jgi:hypothetical protein
MPARRKGDTCFMADTGTLVVGRLTGRPGKFIVMLVNAQMGKILETSVELTEEEVRKLLADNYGESAAQIEMRIQQANTSPEV